MTTRISSLSVQYIDVPVTTDADPTGNDVEMAFTASGIEPESGDWATAAWDGAASTVPSGYRATARVLLDVSTLAADPDGTWHVWVRIAGGAETVVIDTGTITVY